MRQDLTNVTAELASARRQNAALKVVQRGEAGQRQKQLEAERGAIEEKDVELQAGRRALVLEKQNNQGLQVLVRTLREQMEAGKRQQATSQSGEPDAAMDPSGGPAAGGLVFGSDAATIVALAMPAGGTDGMRKDPVLNSIVSKNADFRAGLTMKLL